MSAGLYTLIPEERLRDVLTTLSEFTELPVRLGDGDGTSLMTVGSPVAGCGEGADCAGRLRRAGQRAGELREGYIFPCCEERVCITYPLMRGDDLFGTVIVGPFRLEDPDAGEGDPGDLQTLLPGRVNRIKKLLEYLLEPLIPVQRAAALETRAKMQQQARVNETIQTYKEKGSTGDHAFFYEKENLLLAKVRTGNVQEAKALLNELIGHVLFSEGGRIEGVRMHAIELTALLSRVAMDGGAAIDGIYALNARFLELIGREQRLEDLCYLLQDIVEGFMNAAFYEKDKGNHYVRQALRFMADNFDSDLTLEQVARTVGLSAGHFSQLFHRTVGIPFREHLCRLRIEESKHLLLTGDYSLSDIALSMGFSDQSSFHKAFKRVTGLTPGQYRDR